MTLGGDHLLGPDGRPIVFGWRGQRADGAVAVLTVGPTCSGAFRIDLSTPGGHVAWLAPRPLRAFLGDIRGRLARAGYAMAEADGQVGELGPLEPGSDDAPWAA
jgi:hypothetical protein